MAVDVRGALTTHLGPLPAWAWGALGGGGLWLLSKYRANTAAVTSANSGGLGLLPQPAVGAVGSDPNAGQPVTGDTTQPETLGGLLGPLDSFISGLPNAPNSFALALPGGAAVTFSNGVPTFGNGLGLQPGPTVLNPGQTFVGGNPFWDFLNQFGIQRPGSGTPAPSPAPTPGNPPGAAPTPAPGGRATAPTPGVLPLPIPGARLGPVPTGTPGLLPFGR